MINTSFFLLTPLSKVFAHYWVSLLLLLCAAQYKKLEVLGALLTKIKLSMKIKSLFLGLSPESRPSVWEVKAAAFEDLLLSAFLHLLALGLASVLGLSNFCPGLQHSEDYRESVWGPDLFSPRTDEVWAGHIGSNATSPAYAEHFQLQLCPHKAPPNHKLRR